MSEATKFVSELVLENQEPAAQLRAKNVVNESGLCDHIALLTLSGVHCLELLHGAGASKVGGVGLISEFESVDLKPLPFHIPTVSFDISHILKSWDYKAGEVMVRRLKGKDGVEKIQLRVDLGILQMNAEGRPDGKRPSGRGSLLELFQLKLKRHLAQNDDSDDGFELNEEDCSRLQLEVLQYHHRYLCLLQLQDFKGAIRDARHNLRIFEFAERYAESDDLAWSLKQFQPHVLMVLSRARASEALADGDYEVAISRVEEGLNRLRHFYQSHAKPEMVDNSGEIRSLEVWLDKIRSDRPLSSRELLEKALDEAVQKEDYEKAAEMRDALKNLATDG